MMRVLGQVAVLLVLGVMGCSEAPPPSDLPSPVLGTKTGAQENERSQSEDARLAAKAGPDGTLGVLVRIAAGADRGPLKAFVSGQGATVAYEYTLVPDVIAVRGLPAAALNGLRNSPGVTALYEDRQVTGSDAQSLPLMKADDASIAALGFTGAGVTVCIIDTGLDKDHPCFAPGQLVAEYDFVNSDSDATDDQGHGTHVAGIVACRDTAQWALRGVAPDASLAVAKVLDAAGSGSTSNIIAAMQWCSQTVGAEVMNLSLGGGSVAGDCDWDPEAEAVSNAAVLGTTAAIATGNENAANAVSYPACSSRAIAVGAVYDANMGSIGWQPCTDSTTAADKIVCFSNEGTTVDVTAPGSIITAAQNNGTYTNKSGTSMATPHVAGMLALLEEAHPEYGPDDLRAILWAHSDDTGVAGWDIAHGNGRVNALRALTEPLAVACAVAADCDDGDACTTDACTGGRCARIPACDDSDACTTDTCTGGACSYGVETVADALTCTADSCDTCLGVTHEPTGLCGDLCSGAVPLRVGQTVNGTLVGAGRNYSTTCANGYSQSGKDVAYKVYLNKGEHLKIAMTAAADLSVYVVAEAAGGGNCNTSRCFTGADGIYGSGTETIPAFTPPYSGWFYVIVDAYNRNTATTFTLALTAACYGDEAGEPCDDKNACTHQDTCQADGTCAGSTTPSCDDANACTTDAWDAGAGQCTNTPIACNDGNACTTDACAPATGCTFAAAADGAPCSDSAFCNGAETCQDGACSAGVTPCDDAIGCTVDACDEAADACTNAPNDGACSDGVFCNGAETCSPTTGCVAGPAPNCDDGIACTEDACSEALDACTHAPQPAACSDGAFCNGAESCDPATGCQAGAAPCSADAVDCTVDACDEAADACTHAPSNALCDDALFCNGAETCAAQARAPAGGQGGAAPCADGVACTLDACDEGADACSYAPSDALCSNGLFCDGAETCDAQAGCQGGAAPCGDTLPCTIDTCDDDQDTCASTPSDALCDDGNGCTSDSCDPVSGCLNAPLADGAACSDGAFCNGDETCLAGACQAGTPVDCVDAIACTTDACNEAIDACVNAPDDGPCSDGAVCNGAEVCDAALGCLPGVLNGCDDGVACTADACDAELDACTHVTSDAMCANGAYCDGTETCDAAAGCLAGVAPCNDGVGCTVDACDEAADTCSATPSDVACDNGLACDGAETCDATLGCQAGTAVVCDDLVACTTDACTEPAGECAFAPVDATCADPDACNGAETCDALAGGCVSGTPVDCSDGVGCTTDSCDPATGACGHAPDAAACIDGLYCNGTESCDPIAGCTAGAPVDCSDGVDCTMDACDEASDACTHAPDDAGCIDAEFCNGAESCDPAAGCVSGAPVSCGDAVACTADGCDEGADACIHTPADGACTDGLYCNGSESCDVALGCQAGSPVACNDGSSCTNDACDEATDACQFVDNGSCTTCGNGVCEGNGETCFTCPGDCRCGGSQCKKACCGNGACENGENTTNCDVDC